MTDLDGGNGIRRIAARWVVTADLVLITAAHLGGCSADTVDMVLLRDAVDGRPLLTGASLGGALRAHLTDRLYGYGSAEGPRVQALFGAARSATDGSQSSLIVFDAWADLAADRFPEIRDGVKIDGRTGTAEEHKKFDLEVLPSGTVFAIRLDVLVEDTGNESELMSLLATAAQGLAPGEIALGARRSRGLGAIAARRWRARRFDLSSGTGWLEWLTAEPLEPIVASTSGAGDLRTALQQAHPSAKIAADADRRERAIVDITLQAPAGLLIRGPAVRPDSPDTAHLTSGGRSIVPGTSLAGVLRSRALKIARLVRDSESDARAWVDHLFGFVDEGGRGISAASRLRVSEAVLSGGTRIQGSRVRVDRFTGGTVDGALFDEEPEYKARFDVRIELRRPAAGAIGLLLLVVKDLLLGDIAIGGTSSIGRGAVQGTARLSIDGQPVVLDPDRTLDAAAAARLNAYVQEFASATPPARKERRS